MKAIKLIIVSVLLFSFLASARGQEGPGTGTEAGTGTGTGTTIVDVLRSMFPQATIEVDPLTSTLIIKAPPSLQKKIEGMIERLDVYHPQITVEAKFVELTVNNINELGIDTDIANIVLRKGKNIDMDVITNWADADTSFPESGAAWSLWYTKLSNTAFQSVLRALSKKKKVNVLSAPMVTTLNGQKATIEITQTIPYVSAVSTQQSETGSGTTRQTNYTIEEEDAGIFLEVTPRVPEGSTLITLDIKPTVRELVKQIDIFAGLNIPADLGWPVIDERTTNTTLVIDSGETVVLGGLIRDNSRMVEKKTPLLGDIPLLGYAFRHKYSKDEKKNLLIFITAYLLSPSGEKTVVRR